MKYTEAELLDVLTSLCIKYGIDVCVNPAQYEINSPTAVDVEHDEEGNLVGIGLYDGTRSYYFTEVTESLDIELQNLDLIAHNGHSDFELLRQWGVLVSDSQLTWDTFLIGHIIDSSLKTYGLKDMAKRELAIEYPDYNDIVGKLKAKVRRTLDQWPVSIVAMYNGLDCYATYKLYKLQTRNRLEKPDLINKVLFQSPVEEYFNALEKPVSYVFAAMETRGIRLNLPYLKHLKADLGRQRDIIRAQIWNEFGEINLNSPKQLLGALHEKGIKPIFKGKPSTDKRALQTFKNNPTVEKILHFSELETLLSSFVYPYLERNVEVVHPRFSQTGTRTGRPSCSNPNLLQIPKRTDNGKLVRRMFIPRDGYLFGDCDFGQIEPRVLAHLSKDPVLCQMFNDGVDFHTFTADRLSISRDRAKVLNLSVGYRATKWSVQHQLGGTLEEAQKQIDLWWSLFPSLRRWQEKLIHDSKKSGFCTTLLGRRIKVEGLAEGFQWKRENAERQLINNIAQGSAAEIMKMAMIKIDKEMGHGAYQAVTKFGLLVQVYDELLFEADQRDIELIAQEVKTHMEQALKLDVPLTVDCNVGPNWADVKPYE